MTPSSRNGQLAIEAEAGQFTGWVTQTVQSDFAGSSYLRGLPDVGALYAPNDSNSPTASFAISITNPATYRLWLRGMASDAGGDSVHLSLTGSQNAQMSLTGFAPSNEWEWQSLTLNSSDATLPLTSAGAYTLTLTMREDGLRIDRLLLTDDLITEPSGQGPAASTPETITTTVQPVIQQVIEMTYDELYRLAAADYSGTLNALYEYEHDAVGNRLTYTTTITSSEVITYAYDAADRLIESVDLTSSEVTTYTWDDAGRQTQVSVAGNTTRSYSYSQDGDMLTALVDGLQTTFVYNGNGQRLQLSNSGITTTFMLDYALGSSRNRILYESNGDETKHYLYGDLCLGEHVEDTTTQETEWRQYQYDGNSLVRQTTNEQTDITYAWTFSPEGAIILGEEGPVTHLSCVGDAVYDFSTGLIFRNGRIMILIPTLGLP